MNVLIAHSYALVRALLAAVVREAEQSAIINEAPDGNIALASAFAGHPELLLIDLRLRALRGLEVIAALRKSSFQTKIVVVTRHSTFYDIYRLEALAIDGYVSDEDCQPSKLRLVIRTVLDGGKHFSSSYDLLRSNRRRDPLAFDKLLTNHEIRLLELLGDLQTDEEIAHKLGCCTQTIAKQRLNLGRKLALTNRVELERYARANGFRTLFH